MFYECLERECMICADQCSWCLVVQDRSRGHAFVSFLTQNLEFTEIVGLFVGERSGLFVKWCVTFIEPLISAFCVSQTLPGNWNYYQVKRNVFHYAFTAKHLRIYPMGWNTENGGKIGLRVEFYGCPYGKQHTELLATALVLSAAKNFILTWYRKSPQCFVMLTGPLSCTAENNSLISILVLFSSKYILHVLKNKIIFRCFFHKNKEVRFLKHFTPLNENIFSYCKTYYIIFPLKYFVSCFKNVSILILEIMRFVCVCAVCCVPSRVSFKC